MKEYATKLEEILFLDGDGGRSTASRAEMEAALRSIKHLLDSLQQDTEKLTGTCAGWDALLTWSSVTVTVCVLAGLERRLQEQLSSTNTTQTANGQRVHSITTTENHIQRQRQSYNRNMEKVLTLVEEIKGKLEEAKDDLRWAVRLQTHMVQPAEARALLALLMRMFDLLSGHSWWRRF